MDYSTLYIFAEVQTKNIPADGLTKLISTVDRPERTSHCDSGYIRSESCCITYI